ncbi:MAG: acetolactate synthase small subunit [Succinivibrionaceae bacterium]|nr:acetolactate synthase small subunit [Succinivibrionaceae bacterium]
MRRTISILLENESGALSRVVGLFSQRGFNIENITAAPTENDTVSRITILTKGDSMVVEHITKQLHKLVNVIKVVVLDDFPEGCIEREILFLKVQAATRAARDEVQCLCGIFRAEIVDVTPDLFVIQYVGEPDEVDRFLRAVRGTTDVVEVVRSGVCGISRGERTLHS